MLVAFWILLLLYVGLIILYLAGKPGETKIPPWPILDVSPSVSKSSTCASDDDCPPSHLCLGKMCVPKLPGADFCDPFTGKWISYLFQGVAFAVCVCLEPLLMNQKVFGGNCDTEVGCGTHGRYLFEANRCECDPGYKAVGLSCQKLPAVHFEVPCEEGEIKVSEIDPHADGFHDDYVKNLPPTLKCVKRPCSFDALNGRPLKHGKFLPGWGCVCDPRYGLFGVVLEGSGKKYTDAPGFDACASIFTKDLQNPIRVRLVTYFYLGKREPLSIVLFDDPLLDDQGLVAPLFRGTKNIMLTQQRWQYDYAQHFFNVEKDICARTRRITLTDIFKIEIVNEWLYATNFKPLGCHVIPNLWRHKLSTRADAYKLLYFSPVCRVSQNDDRADPMFWGKVVVNPQHLTFDEHTNLHRFNAFVLKHELDKDGIGGWVLDLDYDYKVDLYSSIETNVPQYHIPSKPMGRDENLEVYNRIKPRG